MDWFGLSLAAAFTQATSDAIVKSRFSHLGPYEMGTVRLLYALPWLGLALFFIPVPQLDAQFFLTVAMALPVEILALVCYMSAIRSSPLSLTLPFLSFTPVFLVATGRLILGERLSSREIAGVALIVTGSYLLNISSVRRGLLAPLRAMLGQRGPRLMLLTAFLYSITSALGKRAILHSSSAFFGVFYFACLAVVMSCMLPLFTHGKAVRLVGRPLSGLALGLVYAAMVFTHTAAISMTQAASMIALKRTSMLFAILYGALFFRETDIGQRLLGAGVMMAGVLVLGFAA
ncbi:MAG TPA: DMT family transporter [Deltaproteobacteria bacterium]|nr:DMT family transporter [Deltaproteobacteria bacterium]